MTGGNTHPGRTTDFSKHAEFFFLHDTAEAKVCDHDIGIFGFGAEEQVFGLQVYVW